MSDDSSNALLGELLVRLYRSLLQYTIECWPWTDAGQTEEYRAIEEMAASQREQVARIAEMLDRRQQAVDYGVYPDWSNLHYVAIDYLLGKLVDDQTHVVAEVRRIKGALAGDTDANSLVAGVLLGEERHLTRLKDLAARDRTLAPA